MHTPPQWQGRPQQPHHRRSAGVPLCGLTLALFVAAPRSASAAFDVWTTAGPNGVVVNTLAADPLAGTVYAGSGGYGVFKSADHGGTWQPADAGLEHTYIESIALDPVYPATLFAASAGRGVFVTTDRAESWQAMNEGLPSLSAHLLALDAARSTLYVATTDGVFRSVEGEAWTPTALLTRRDPTNSGDVSLSAWIDCLAIDPATNTLYACFFSWSDQPGPGWQLLQSTDGGTTWNDIALPTTGGPIDIAIDHLGPTLTLYVVTYEPLDLTSEVLRSRDGGAHWEPVGGVMPGCEGECKIDRVTVSSGEPTVLYAATDHGVYMKFESDSSWRALGSGLATTEVTTVAVDAVNPMIVYAATSDGVFSLQRAAACGGDCDGDGAVSIADLVTMVDIALGQMSMDACTAGDMGSDGEIGVADVVGAVGHALDGCGAL